MNAYNQTIVDAGIKQTALTKASDAQTAALIVQEYATGKVSAATALQALKAIELTCKLDLSVIKSALQAKAYEDNAAAAKQFAAGVDEINKKLGVGKAEKIIGPGFPTASRDALRAPCFSSICAIRRSLRSSQ